MDLIFLLAGVGFLLLLIEVFVPGGVLGVLGGLLLVAAIVLGYVQFGWEAGSILLVGLGGTALTGFTIWMSFFPRTAAGRRFMLSKTLVAGSGSPPGDHGLAGWEGVAVTPLRPAGKALIDGRRLDVIAESEFLDAETPVVVVSVDGTRVVVRKKA